MRLGLVYAFETSKPTPSDKPPPARLCLLIFPQKVSTHYGPRIQMYEPMRIIMHEPMELILIQTITMIIDVKKKHEFVDHIGRK